jgi:hypothetical protein
MRRPPPHRSNPGKNTPHLLPSLSLLSAVSVSPPPIPPTPSTPRPHPHPHPHPQTEGRTDIADNAYRSDPGRIRMQRAAYMRLRGPDCFDHEYYAEKNPDLRSGLGWGGFRRGGWLPCVRKPMPPASLDCASTHTRMHTIRALASCRVWHTKEELWAHFLRGGAFEGRNFRFTCDMVL